MAYYVYEQGSNKLLELSDSPIAESKFTGEFYASTPLSVDEINLKYSWDEVDGVWKLRNIGYISKLEFLRRFTLSERIAIRTKAKTDPIVEDFMDLLELSQVIGINDTDTINGLNYLSLLGILSTERIQEILA